VKRLFLLLLLAGCKTVAPPGYTILLGNLHSQTNHSDGGYPVDACNHAERPQSGTFGPSDAYAMAREQAGLSFLLTSEHNHMFDGSTATRADATLAEVRALFHSGLDAAELERHAHPEFIAMYGVEFGVIAKGGHINIVNATRLPTWERDAQGALLGDVEVGKYDYRALYQAMRAHAWIGQFNHPEKDQFAIDDVPLAVDPDGLEVMALCEVANSSAFSTSLDESDTKLKSFAATCDRLLLAGYRVSPTSNQDNHCANWGLSAPNRTGVLVTGPGIEAFYEALRARRTFATTDKGSAIVLRSGEHLMGDILAHAGPLAITVEHDGPDAIAKVEIVHGEIGAAKTEVVARTMTATIDVPARGRHFYYARITETDGTKLWSAPLWVDP